MEESIKDIQNTLWAMWKNYQKDGSIQNYEQSSKKLCLKYRNNPLMYNFCQNMVISWCPVINGYKENTNEEEKAYPVYGE